MLNKVIAQRHFSICFLLVLKLVIKYCDANVVCVILAFVSVS